MGKAEVFVVESTDGRLVKAEGQAEVVGWVGLSAVAARADLVVVLTWRNAGVGVLDLLEALQPNNKKRKKTLKRSIPTMR